MTRSKPKRRRTRWASTYRRQRDRNAEATIEAYLSEGLILRPNGLYGEEREPRGSRQ